MRKLDPKKCQKILEIIKKKSPTTLNEVQQEVWKRKIYIDSKSIYDALNYLKRNKKIKWKIWRIEAV